MANLLVVGSVEVIDSNITKFVQYLAEDIVDQGHTLLNGCINELDATIAKFAYERLTTKEIDPNSRILCYVCTGSKPVHNYGSIFKSRLSHIRLAQKRLEVPEIVKLADAIILIGGTEGTMLVANWGRIDNTPLFPITAFGGTAELTYHEEIGHFSPSYSKNISQIEYELLNQISLDWKKIAMQIVSLVEKCMSSKYVFAIMPFSKNSRYEDAYESFKEVCTKFQYECSRVDDSNTTNRIIPEIFDRIKRSAFIIADLSEQKPNVYYELGYAHGLNIPVVVTAFKDTLLPFDVRDIPTIFWESQQQLKKNLIQKISEIALKQGR